MFRISIVFLRMFIILIGIGALTALLWEPHLEGRNVNATLFEIYLKDPFLGYVYFASLPFFAGLFQIFKLLKYVGEDKAFSLPAVNTIRTVRYCAFAIITGVVIGVIIIIFSHGNDDLAGGVFLGALIAFGSVVTVTASFTIEQILRNGMNRISQTEYNLLTNEK